MPPQQPREQCCRVEDSFVPSIGFRIEDSRVEGQGLFPKQKQHGNTVGFLQSKQTRTTDSGPHAGGVEWSRAVWSLGPRLHGRLRQHR